MLLLFPLIMNYFSPYIIIDGASLGIVDGSLMVFGLMFLSALFVGRLWCGWACPMDALQEFITAANNGRFRTGKRDWIKWFIWLPWTRIACSRARILPHWLTSYRVESAYTAFSLRAAISCAQTRSPGSPSPKEVKHVSVLGIAIASAYSLPSCEPACSSCCHCSPAALAGPCSRRGGDDAAGGRDILNGRRR
jgi:hypothetical protein